MEKITKWAMLILFIIVIPMNIISENYLLASWQFIAFMWFGLAWLRQNTINEMRDIINEVIDYANCNTDNTVDKENNNQEQPLN